VKIDLTFPRQILIAIAGMTAIAVYPLWSIGSGEVVAAVIIGVGLSTINVLAGYLALAYSVDRGDATFLKVVLGGMGVRMITTLGVLVLLIRFAGFPVVPLTTALLSSYVVYLILEIRYMQKRFRPISQGLTR
jgi:hypothetical protein